MQKEKEGKFHEPVWFCIIFSCGNCIWVVLIIVLKMTQPVSNQVPRVRVCKQWQFGAVVTRWCWACQSSNLGYSNEDCSWDGKRVRYSCFKFHDLLKFKTPASALDKILHYLFSSFNQFLLLKCGWRTNKTSYTNVGITYHNYYFLEWGSGILGRQ